MEQETKGVMRWNYTEGRCCPVHVLLTPFSFDTFFFFRKSVALAILRYCFLIDWRMVIADNLKRFKELMRGICRCITRSEGVCLCARETDDESERLEWGVSRPHHRCCEDESHPWRSQHVHAGDTVCRPQKALIRQKTLTKHISTSMLKFHN